MKINYWDCEYHDYNEQWDGEDEIRTYGCSLRNGPFICRLDNKYCEEKANCLFLDKILEDNNNV